MKYSLLFLLATFFHYQGAAQTLPIREQGKIRGDETARRLIAMQPDFTAESTCLNYENTMGHGFGALVKTAKKDGWYRHESETFIDYFIPGVAPVHYTFKNKQYIAYTGEVDNHLWFMSVESPTLLALDKSLKFEIVGRTEVDLKIAGKTKQRQQIKIKVTGKTKIGGDLDKAVAFLYIVPDLKNLVVKTELIFTKGGRNCTLRNISFIVPDGLFTTFRAYRHVK